jgi:hypothetical protein
VQIILGENGEITFLAPTDLQWQFFGCETHLLWQ